MEISSRFALPSFLPLVSFGEPDPNQQRRVLHDFYHPEWTGLSFRMTSSFEVLESPESCPPGPRAGQGHSAIIVIPWGLRGNASAY